MASIQSQIDQMAGKGFSVSNLALNVAGVAKMAAGKKDVYITLSGKTGPYGLLEGDTRQKMGFAADYLGLNSVVMYADVSDNSELCEHPLESGAKVVDHQIQLPVEIKLQIVLPYYFYESVYKQLKDLKEKGTYVCVHTKAGMYDRMIFKDIPHKESVENIDRLVFDCTLKQAFLVTGIQGSLKLEDVKYAPEATTKNLGVKNGVKQDETIACNTLQSFRNVVNKYSGNIIPMGDRGVL